MLYEISSSDPHVPGISVLLLNLAMLQLESCQLGNDFLADKPPWELESKLRKEGCTGDYLGDYYRGY